MSEASEHGRRESIGVTEKARLEDAWNRLLDGVFDNPDLLAETNAETERLYEEYKEVKNPVFSSLSEYHKALGSFYEYFKVDVSSPIDYEVGYLFVLDAAKNGDYGLEADLAANPYFEYLNGLRPYYNNPRRADSEEEISRVMGLFGGREDAQKSLTDILRQLRLMLLSEPGRYYEEFVKDREAFLDYEQENKLIDNWQRGVSVPNVQSEYRCDAIDNNTYWLTRFTGVQAIALGGGSSDLASAAEAASEKVKPLLDEFLGL